MNTEKYNPERVLRICYLLITGVLIITRLPFYLYYPVTGITFDSASYCAVAFDLMDLNIPSFEIRTPGYPVFLSLVWLFSKSFYAVSLLQSVFTLFTSLFFLRTVFRYYPSYIIYFTISLIIFISSSYFLLFETALLTEGLFVNLLLLNNAFLISALKKNTVSSWIIFSVSIAVTNLVRPAGLFLISLIVILTFYFIIKKYNYRLFAALILPATVLLLSLCLYNFVTLRSFTLTPFGEANLSGVTITFMEKSDEYPEIVNNAIDEVLKTVPKKDIPYVKNSFGVTKLYDVFLFNYDKVIEFVAAIKRQDSNMTYTDIQPLIRKVYLDAIKNHPDIYLKFVAVNFMQFFRNIGKDLNYFDAITKSYGRIFLERKYVNRLEKGGWQQVSSDETDYLKIRDLYIEEINKNIPGDNVTVTDTNKVVLKQTYAKSFNETYEKIYNLLFRNIIWLVLFAITFLLCVYRLLKSKLSDIDALIFFFMGVMFISKALMVSLVECSLERYSYTVEFVSYFSLPFLIILLKNPSKKLNLKTDTV
ncbi:MAG TPA: hypothetical protein PKD83_06025 [Ignavibacteria bacterium]|nr:hypothetical protein [Ignavibacteria bacterium]